MFAVSNHHPFLLHAFLICISVTAVAGLSVATAPNLSHYLTFFLPIAARDDLGAGLAICLAAASAAALFVTVAVLIINCEYFFEHRILYTYNTLML